MTAAEHKVGFKQTKDTPYLTLMGKLWGVFSLFCVYFGENWLSYNGTAPYMYDIYIGLLFQVCIWTQEILVMYPNIFIYKIPRHLLHPRFPTIIRLHALSQWEMTLHCNIISHWLGAYTNWSLCFLSQHLIIINMIYSFHRNTPKLYVFMLIIQSPLAMSQLPLSKKDRR